MVFPVVDVREDRKVSIAECGSDRPPLVLSSGLSHADYAVDKGITSDLTLQDFQTRNSARLKQSPNGGDPYIAMIFLETFGFAAALTTFDYKMSAFIVRTDSGEIVWNDSQRPTKLLKWQGLVGGPLNRLVGEVYYRGETMSLCRAFRSIATDLFVNLPQLAVY
jgi:hypothetical protein